MSTTNSDSKKKHNSNLSSVMSITSTAYLVDIDNEATVVIAENISEALMKAEIIAKSQCKIAYNKSLPLLY